MSKPQVDIDRPAFAGNSKLCALALAKKCVTCQKDVGSFPTELQRKEYGISGMCSGCQTSFFRPQVPRPDPPGYKAGSWGTATVAVDHFALLRGIHKIQERGGSAQDEDNYLRRMGFHEKHPCAIGECEPLREMSKANEACAECLKSIMENSVVVGEISRGRNSAGYIYSCSLHGENAECVDATQDKRETWECRECGASGDFRVWYYHDCI